MFYGLFFIFGVVFGSFGNVIVCRIPREENIRGRSACPNCKKILTPYDLIPIVSFLFLRGRCRSCNKKISIQYPLIELISGLLFLYAASIQGISIIGHASIAFALWLLFLIAIIDFKTERISDALNVPLLLIAVTYSFSTGSFDYLSIIVGIGLIGMQWLLSGGRWIGSGDVILIASLSLLVGSWQHMLLCLFLAYILGAIVASFLLLTGKKKRQDSLAFAPFLAGGFFIAFAFGDLILQKVYGI